MNVTCVSEQVRPNRLIHLPLPVFASSGKRHKIHQEIVQKGESNAISEYHATVAPSAGSGTSSFKLQLPYVFTRSPKLDLPGPFGTTVVP